jgi:hypothetical protein
MKATITKQKLKGETPKRHVFYDINDLIAYYGFCHEDPTYTAIRRWISCDPSVTNGCILYWNNLPDIYEDDLDDEDGAEKIPPAVDDFIKTCCEEFGEDSPIHLDGEPPKTRKELKVYYWW